MSESKISEDLGSAHEELPVVNPDSNMASEPVNIEVQDENTDTTSPSVDDANKPSPPHSPMQAFNTLFQQLKTRSQQSLQSIQNMGDLYSSPDISYETIWTSQIQERLIQKKIWASFVLVQRRNRLGFISWVQHIAVVDLFECTFFILNVKGLVMDMIGLGSIKLIKKLGSQQIQLTATDVNIVIQCENYKVRDNLVKILQSLRTRRMREQEELDKLNPYAKYGVKAVRRSAKQIIEEKAKVVYDPTNIDQNIELSAASEATLRKQIDELAEGMNEEERNDFLEKMEATLSELKQEISILEKQQSEKSNLVNSLDKPIEGKEGCQGIDRLPMLMNIDSMGLATGDHGVLYMPDDSSEVKETSVDTPSIIES